MKFWKKFTNIFKDKIEDGINSAEYSEECVIVCELKGELYIMCSTDVYPYLENLNMKSYIENSIKGYSILEKLKGYRRNITVNIPTNIRIFNNVQAAYHAKDVYERTVPFELHRNSLIVLRKLKNNSIVFTKWRLNRGSIKDAYLIVDCYFNRIVPDNPIDDLVGVV